MFGGILHDEGNIGVLLIMGKINKIFCLDLNQIKKLKQNSSAIISDIFSLANTQ